MTKPPPAWGPPSLDYLSPAHILDFPSLDRGHPAISKTVVQISDIEVNVHGLEEATGSGGVVIMVSKAAKASQLDTGWLSDSQTRLSPGRDDTDSSS